MGSVMGDGNRGDPDSSAHMVMWGGGDTNTGLDNGIWEVGDPNISLDNGIWALVGWGGPHISVFWGHPRVGMGSPSPLWPSVRPRGGLGTPPG